LEVQSLIKDFCVVKSYLVALVTKELLCKTGGLETPQLAFPGGLCA
jgi:hypothetical protein